MSRDQHSQSNLPATVSMNLPAAGSYAAPRSSAVASAPHSGEPSGDSPLRKVHALLRGRYHWAILLGAILAGALGYLGYISVTPLYQSKGMIRIRPSLPMILYKSEQSSVMPMFTSYVAAQIELMQSPRVLNMAMGSDAWQALHRPSTPEEKMKFMTNLSVDQTKSSEMIAVTYNDPSPKAAQVAVKSVIDAYMQIFGESDAQSDTQRMQILENQRQTTKSQLGSLRDQILAIANQYGSDALDEIYQFKVQELQKLEQALKETQLSLAMAGAKATVPASGSATAPTTQPQELTVDQIAAQDQHMAQLMDKKQSIQQQIQLLTLRFGPNYQDVVQAKTRLEMINKAIQQYAVAYRKYSAADSAVRGISAGLPGQPSVPQLRARLSQLEQLYNDAKKETVTLGRKKLQIDSLKNQETSAQATLQLIDSRIKQINVESSVSGRIQVISDGDIPLATPVNHSKIRQRAALGVVGGGAIGVGFIMLLGLMDRRLHTSEDAVSSGKAPRLLGVLPTLPEDVADPEYAQLAGSCVHHIRTLLQLSPDSHDHQVFAITGPVSGTGKTSLTLALGLSYATAGSRTLLIDSDLAGGGLTARLQTIVRRRIGQVLVRTGCITQDQLDQTLADAKVSGQRLGELLIERGLASGQDISEALSLQQKASIGLLDALAGEPLDLCITDTGIADLSILPVGGAHAHDASRVSPAALRQVVAQVRDRFDIILIDTGPVPGNVETSLAAAAADQVVMVVSRGDDRALVERAAAYLRSIGAPIAGVVFNRAKADDLARSAYVDTSKLSMSRHFNPDANRPVTDVHNPAPNGHVNGHSNGHTPTKDRTSRFGPVARAVVSSSQPAQPPKDKK